MKLRDSHLGILALGSLSLLAISCWIPSPSGDTQAGRSAPAASSSSLPVAQPAAAASSVPVPPQPPPPPQRSGGLLDPGRPYSTVLPALEDMGGYAIRATWSLDTAWQRLLLSLVLQRPALLREVSQQLDQDPSPNHQTLLAVCRWAAGEGLTGDENARSFVAYFQEHPGLLQTVVRIHLAQMCRDKRQRSHPNPDGSCPFDADAALVADAQGVLHCPHESQPSHFLAGPAVSEMLCLRMALDPMSRARPNDDGPLRELGRLAPGRRVADIGAGSGAYTFPLARLVGPKGKIWAVEVEERLIELLRSRACYLKARNVEVVMGALFDVRLRPKSVDVALLIDVQPSFRDPDRFFNPRFVTSLRKALRPGGALLFAATPPRPAAQVYAAYLAPYGFKLDKVKQGFQREYVLFKLKR